LEVAKALAELGVSPRPGEPLPIPETLADLLERRVRRLPARTRESLLAAASLSDPNISLLDAALGRDVGADLQIAERAGVVRVRDRRVEFSHPLLASTVYRDAPAVSRRGVHFALARVVAEPEQYARHLALATSEPDQGVAGALDMAAAAAASRGASEVAVEFAELACKLTPPGLPYSLAERRLSLADYEFRAGDAEEARRLAGELWETLAPGPGRARTAELLARVLHVAGTAAEAAAPCLQVVADAPDDPELQAKIHATIALVSWHDFGLARHHALLAFKLLDDLHDPAPSVVSRVLTAFAQAEFYTGHELPLEVIERGLEAERLAPEASVADRLSAALGVWLKYQGDFDGARRWLELTHAAAIAEGDDSSLPYALSHLPQLELWAGNWERALSLAREHLELADQMGQPAQRRQALFNLSSVQAHMGQVEDTRAVAGELLREAQCAEDEWDVSNAVAVLGFLELSLGDAKRAAPLLGRAFELREGLGAKEPVRSYADYAEALVEIGNSDRAAEIVAMLEARARTARRETLLAVALRDKGLVAAARGDLDEGKAALDDAIEHHRQVTVPFDLARTLLAQGQVSRRRGERKGSKALLEEAGAIFHQLGAPVWEGRCEGELRRIPIRRGAPSQLTATEEQVAERAASGMTNREVAQALFISPKTVEVNLARVYRKLGISSRAELGARMAARTQQGVPPKP
jgi:DNA-binding CsgD family transcriptional regulator